jgi:hypothetical protein
MMKCNMYVGYIDFFGCQKMCYFELEELTQKVSKTGSKAMTNPHEDVFARKGSVKNENDKKT